jgi:hypothetical protein
MALELLPLIEQLRQVCKAVWTLAVQMHAASVHVWRIKFNGLLKSFRPHRQRTVKAVPSAAQSVSH